MAYRIRSLFVIALVLLLVACTTARTFFRIPRELSEQKLKTCYKSTPCGWSIYEPITKEIVDFMPNTCTCEPGLGCIKAEEDLSVYAFVHRCRPQDPDNLQKVTL